MTEWGQQSTTKLKINMHKMSSVVITTYQMEAKSVGDQWHWEKSEIINILIYKKLE